MKFLAELRHSGLVSNACRVSGVSRTCAYAHRQKEPDFAEAWDVAEDIGVSKWENEARRRAVDGVERYQVSGGKVVMHNRRPIKIKEFSDHLMKMILCAKRPEYRDHQTVDLGNKPGESFRATINDERAKEIVGGLLGQRQAIAAGSAIAAASNQNIIPLNGNGKSKNGNGKSNGHTNGNGQH